MKGAIAIVGASGNVGRKVVELLLENGLDQNYPIKLFASAKSDGKKLIIHHKPFIINDIAKYDFKDCSLALFATESHVSKMYINKALEAGAKVVDSSSLYRLTSSVPLIVPPVNGELIQKDINLYATANCLACPIAVVVKPLHDYCNIRRIIASTYQSASGAGKAPMDELISQTRTVLEQDKHLKPEKLISSYFPRPLPFNVVPQVDKIEENGFTFEEIKIMKEVQKLISPDLKILATAARVPVLIGHSISLSIDFDQPMKCDQIKKILSNSPGVQLCQDYLTPIEVVGKNDVFVGRLRKDPSSPHGIALWLTSDNLRRGAALDIVEIGIKILSLN